MVDDASLHLCVKHLTPNSDLGDELVTLYVGANRKKVSIHKKLICNKFDFFDKAFNGGFKEGSGIMELPEDDEDAISHLVSWLYTEELLRPEFDELPNREVYPAEITPIARVKQLVSLVVLADKLCNHEFMNKLMDVIVKANFERNTILVGEGAELMYTATRKDSMARRYCLASLSFLPRIGKDPRYGPNYNDEGDLLTGHCGLTDNTEAHSEMLKELLGFLGKYWREINEGQDLRHQGVSWKDEKMVFNNWQCAFYHLHPDGRGCIYAASYAPASPLFTPARCEWDSERW